MTILFSFYCKIYFCTQNSSAFKAFWGNSMSISIQVIISACIRCLFSFVPLDFRLLYRFHSSLLSNVDQNLVQHKIFQHYEMLNDSRVWGKALIFEHWHVGGKGEGRPALFYLNITTFPLITRASLIFLISLWFIADKVKQEVQKFSIRTLPQYVMFCLNYVVASLLSFPGMAPSVVVFFCICFMSEFKLINLHKLQSMSKCLCAYLPLKIRR